MLVLALSSRNFHPAHPAPDLHSLTSPSLNARPSPHRLLGRSVSDHRRPRPVHTKTGPTPASTTSPERSQDMHPSHPVQASAAAAPGKDTSRHAGALGFYTTGSALVIAAESNVRKSGS